MTTISIATHVLAEAWRIDMTAHSNDFASPRNFTPNRPQPLTASSIAHSTDCRPSLKPVAMTCWRRAINHLVVITGLSWHLDEHPIGISKWGLRAIKVN
ncbi:hypothetical protein M1857_14000 [Lactiplantibacillus plantarum]|nr:hypothetical protein P3T69_04995 [Lactiplantibacillus plantarum]WHQ54098.1 hypothetical protein M1857_14000 [Lactiplantibacillus plantarum]